MSETLTITAKTLTDQLGDFFVRLTNFNASQSEFDIQQFRVSEPDIFEIMLASEGILAKEWNSAQEDDAWAST